ncbi:MAG: hydrolase, partial [Bacteroidota bacterium]
INRQSFGDHAFMEAEDQFNRVLGAEFNLASKNNVWSGKTFIHKSFQPGDNQGNLASQAVLVYNTRFWNLVSDWVYVDQDFRSDLGFVPRTGIFKSNQSIGRTFYPKKGVINKHTPRILNLMFWRPQLDFLLSDHELRLSYDLEFRDRSTWRTRFRNRFIYLVDGFDPTRTDGGVPLPGETGYRFNQIETEYESNRANPVIFQGEFSGGQFFNGRNLTARGELTFRLQPFAQIGVNVRYDRIDLPSPHPSAQFWLATTRFDVTFSKSIFWSTLIQYSNQRDNLGINSRLQWRFAPLSDLFLVYNDNYFVDFFTPRFRSINLKVSYWISL